MTEITKKFTYDLADDYLAQTNELKKTNEWLYNGPDKIWVFVENDSNNVGGFNFLTLENDGPTYPTPLDHIKVEVNCEENPLLCTLLRANKYRPDLNDFPQVEISLPNGEVYKRPKNPDPEHTFEVSEIQYKDGKWSYSWKKPWVTWEDIYKSRDHLVKEAEKDLRLLTSLPESLKEKLQNYIDSLKNIETEWAGYEPYMYVFPKYPL